VEAEATPLITEAVAELIALAAAMAANNGDAFQKHNFRLHKLGVDRADRIRAVNLAIQIKMAPHQDLMDMAEGYLAGGAEGGCGGSCGEEGCGDCAAEGCGEEGCSCGH
jgi:hypothetical protein